MNVLCGLGFHVWEYISKAYHDFRGCQRYGKWQSKAESDRKWQSPGTNIEGSYTTWDEMKARIYEEAEG